MTDLARAAEACRKYLTSRKGAYGTRECDCDSKFEDDIESCVSAIEALAPGDGVREAFTKAALAYAKCHWGKCADECHAHDSGISPEVDDAVHAENETHYRDEMRKAYDAFLRSQP